MTWPPPPTKCTYLGLSCSGPAIYWAVKQPDPLSQSDTPRPGLRRRRHQTPAPQAAGRRAQRWSRRVPVLRGGSRIRGSERPASPRRRPRRCRIPSLHRRHLPPLHQAMKAAATTTSAASPTPSSAKSSPSSPPGTPPASRPSPPGKVAPHLARRPSQPRQQRAPRRRRGPRRSRLPYPR
ncbi:hypothetical protein PVAP13_2NG142721 [Panicum virgatum]|uniref:Uncharacterized protein n=1 Tax=Panicum virgatum TaxID=38727 RepID=A0A8T0VCK7_PANVG|nr:hypothetical protein PVAP13_2NG142721 [Panicum virgatum]